MVVSPRKSTSRRKFVKIDINFGIHPDKVKENELHKYKQINQLSLLIKKNCKTLYLLRN